MRTNQAFSGRLQKKFAENLTYKLRFFFELGIRNPANPVPSGVARIHSVSEDMNLVYMRE